MERIVYRNANIVGYGKGYSLELVDGRVTGITPTDKMPAEGVDLKGRLIAPRFVDSHMHLDKAMVPAAAGAKGLLAAIAASAEYLQQVPQDCLLEDVTRRSGQVVDMALAAGTGCIKTNLLIGGAMGWASLLSLQELRHRYRGRMRLLGAVPLEEGEERAFERHAAAGEIDFIAGYPSLTKDYRAEVDRIFRMAEKYGLPVDLHVDESDVPDVGCFCYVLQKTIEMGMQGRVTCGHVTALSAPGLPQREIDRAVGLAVRAGVCVTTLTSCNLFLMSSSRRGPTLVRELLSAGVPVAVASDNVRDPFRPFGNADLLQEALLTAQVHKLAGEEELEAVFDMITSVPARNCLLEGYGIREGQQADLVILDADSPAEAVRRGGGVLLQYAGGRRLGAAAAAGTF